MTEARTEVAPPARVDHPERVLLVADGGLAGIAATRWLADRAARRPIAVDVLDVLPPDAPSDGDGPGSASAEAGESAAQVQDLLTRLAPGTPVRSEVLRGDPLDLVRDRIDRADLVVVGSNRASAGRLRLAGSFAARIVDRSSRPVVVVPRGWERTRWPILLGVEGDAADDRAVAFAAAEAERERRHLVVLHAWRLVHLGAPPPRLDGRAAEHAADRLEAVVAGIRRDHPAVGLTPMLERESAAHVLDRLGRGCALVVLGRHGADRPDRALHRSIGAQVLDRLDAPVAIVPSG
ncbi:universal stress protein [Amnibacterium kyonggiense]|uniref:Universal stress protein family protein n=1 Tax=Amnibacterium kyonggiense TaxID=595671 RepID=A0A4V3EAL1_9MICO|nr:universal stress protein [Amnibacterium kyonggiense]TDS76864.1 universal stress protein family protein [Amnibacterium kyonggiense]